MLNLQFAMSLLTISIFHLRSPAGYKIHSRFTFHTPHSAFRTQNTSALNPVSRRTVRAIEDKSFNLKCPHEPSCIGRVAE